MVNRNIFISTIILAIAGCTSGVKQASVAPAKEAIALKTDTTLHHVLPAASVFQISQSGSSTLNTPDGGIIMIPKQAFTDLQGNPVSGQVELSYRSYQDVASIIASGIPMMASYGGFTGAFVSDGMFTVTASQHGKELKLADGKQLNVFTPSRDSVSAFKYWYFNTASGAWEFTGERSALVAGSALGSKLHTAGFTATSPPQDDPVNQLVFQKNMPVPYDSSRPVLDIQLDEEEYPELQEYNNILWQYAGSDPAMDPAKNNWIHAKPWTRVDISPRNGEELRYNLAIETDGRTFRTIVQPALKSKDYRKAMNKYREKLKKAEVQAADESLKKKVKVDPSVMYNAFAVAQMGTYNCDRFYNDRQAVTFKPKITCNGKPSPSDVRIYIIMDDNSGVIQYTPEYYKLTIRPELIRTALAVAEGGTVALLSQSGLQQLRNRNSEPHLEFEGVKKRFRTLEDLAGFIRRL